MKSDTALKSDSIREPQQKRSIAKKKRITEAGIQLLCEKGYYNTTTVDIAKAAHVSTGIVYSYFKDKKDILISGLDMLSEQAVAPLLATFQEKLNLSDFLEHMEDLLDYFVDFHIKFQSMHQELGALALSDPDVNAFMVKFEKSLVHTLTNICISHGVDLPNMYEKIHIVYDMVESYCHEVVFYPDEAMDYVVYKQEILSCIHYLLLGSEHAK